MSQIAIFNKSRTQRIVESQSCAIGCRGNCHHSDGECEFATVHPAEAVSEFAGPDDYEPADLEVMAWMFKGALKASVILFLGVVAWQVLDSFSAGVPL